MVNSNSEYSQDQDSKLRVAVFTNYFAYNLANIRNPFTSATASDFYINFLSKERKILKLFELKDLLEEFRHIDASFSVAKNRRSTDWNAIYENFLEKVNSTMTDEDAGAVQQLKAAVFSKLQTLAFTYDDDLIIDVKGFFDNLISKLNFNAEIDGEIGNIETFKRIKDLQSDFKKTLSDKIEESHNFTERQVFVELAALENAIDDDIKKLKNEVDAQTMQLKQHKDQLVKQRADIVHKIKMAKIFGVLKLATSMLSFIGPVGAAVGGVLDMGLTVGQQFARRKRSPNVRNSVSELVKRWNSVQAEQSAKKEQTKAFVSQQLAEMRAETSDVSVLSAIENYEKNIKTQEPTTKKLVNDLNALKRQSSAPKIVERIDKITKHVAVGGVMVNHPLNTTQIGFNSTASLIQHLGRSSNFSISVEKLRKSGHQAFNGKQVDVFYRATNIVQFGGHVLNSLHQATSASSSLLITASSAKAVKFGKNLAKVSKVAAIGGAIGGQVANLATVGQDELAQIDASISTVTNQILQLADYERKIDDAFRPMLNSMMQDMTQATRDLKGQSSVSLDIKQWNVQRVLKFVKLQISQFTKEFEVSEEFIHHVDVLNDLMATIIKIFDRIQEYQYQIELSQYMGNIQIAPYARVDVATNASLYVEKTLIANLIDSQYQRAKNAFNQWLLPFGPHYSEKVERRIVGSGQFDIKQYKNAIVALKDYIDNDRTSVLRHDHYIQTGIFGSKFIDPFFVWTLDSDATSIENLLKGRKVILKATVKPSSKNVVKFQSIEVKLRVDDPEKQHELNEALDHYGVSMTHQGTSFYKCDATVYSVYNGEVRMSHSFEKTSNGAFISTNNVVNKLRDGDYVLSPYAMWEFQITNKNNQFGTLEQFQDLVRVELVGNGLYVDNSYTCSEQLANYYQVDEVETELYRLALAGEPSAPYRDKRSVEAPVSSSGHRPSGLINNVIQWMMSGFTSTFQGGQHISAARPKLGSFEAMPWNMPRMNGVETLALLDTIVRKLTKVKLIHSTCDTGLHLDAQVMALNQMEVAGESADYLSYCNYMV